MSDVLLYFINTKVQVFCLFARVAYEAVMATHVQVATAYRCAIVLRDLIMPHMLRRRKADVAYQLPPKTEQVLFCTLGPLQRELYRAFLDSREVQQIFDGDRHALQVKFLGGYLQLDWFVNCSSELNISIVNQNGGMGWSGALFFGFGFVLIIHF